MTEIRFVNNNSPSSRRGGTETAGADAARAKKKKGKRFRILIILLAILVIAAGVAVYLLYSGSLISQMGTPYLAILEVEGTIQASEDASTSDTYQHDWILASIDDLIDDPDNEALMLYINSPGGTVYQTDELYLKILEYKEETQRPVYSYFAETAASGGYYIAAASDVICANRNTTTGSIGVYMGPVISAQKLLEELGVDVDIIRSARNKAMGNYYETLTDEQRAVYQSVVDEMYAQFVAIVAEGRGMVDSEVLQIADGRIYTAKQAQNIGLVDHVCTYDRAVEFMISEEKLSGNTAVIEYTPEESLYTAILSLSDNLERLASSQEESEAEKVISYIEENASLQPLYMMPTA